MALAEELEKAHPATINSFVELSGLELLLHKVFLPAAVCPCVGKNTGAIFMTHCMFESIYTKTMLCISVGSVFSHPGVP